MEIKQKKTSNVFDSIAIFKQRRECIRYEGNKQRKGKKSSAQNIYNKQKEREQRTGQKTSDWKEKEHLLREKLK